MVDIVQSNVNKLLIRKIGYSVGLESTLSRLNQIVTLYVSERQLTEPAWHSLVVSGFKRDIRASKDFENLFSVLDVFSVENGRPVAHTILDACALLRCYFESSDRKYEVAVRAVFLYALTLSDGELFSTLLSNGFDRARVESALSSFRKRKLETFYVYYRNAFDRLKLHQIIDFQENESKRDTAQQQRPSTGPFAKSKKVLTQDVNDFSVSVSDDWYRKIPARRQSWAEDVGLFIGGDITELGERYLSALKRLFVSQFESKDSGSELAYVLMPLDIEMRAKHVTWALPDEWLIKHSDILQAIGGAFVSVNPDGTYLDGLDLVDHVKWAFDKYTKADIRFHMLRRELPYSVFCLFVLGICVAENKIISELKVDLESLAIKDRSILFRPSRSSVYGISLARK